MCEGKDRKTWEEKIRICRDCEYFISPKTKSEEDDE